MIVIAILATLGALVWSLLVILANGMRSSPGKFSGAIEIAGVWLVTGVIWFAWAVG